MANSGEILDAFSGRSRFALRVAVALSAGGYDIANNRSEWDASLSVHNLDESAATWSNDQRPYSFNVGGHNFSGTTPAGTFDFRDGAAYHNIKLASNFWVSHAADGTLKLNFSGSVSGVYVFGSASASSSIQADRIPRGPRVRYAGTWKNSVAYVRQGGAWKIAVPYVKQSGSWKIAGG